MTLQDPRILADCDIAIVGGGIAGASLAYFLAQENADVCLIERNDLFSAASGSNAGTLHEQTLNNAAPEDRGSVSRQATVIPIMHAGARLWEELGRQWNVDIGVKRTGGMVLADADVDIERLRFKVAAEQGHGGDTRLIEQDELREIAPYVAKSAVRAVFASNEGKFNVLAAATAFTEQLRDAQVQQILNTQVDQINTQAAGYVLQTSRGVVRARRLVLCAGAWNQVLAQMLGWHLPLRIRPIQSAATEPAPPLVLHTLAHSSLVLSLKQNHHGSIIIGGGWPALSPDFNKAPIVQPSSVMGAMAAARQIVPAIGGLRLLRAWASYISTPIDEIPVIGPVPNCPGCFVLQTNRLGMTSGHVLARSLAEIILHDRYDEFARLASPLRPGLCAPSNTSPPPENRSLPCPL